MSVYHTNTGNCHSDGNTFNCTDCGLGNVCDVCHDHDEPRGECSECEPCEKCISEGKVIT